MSSRMPVQIATEIESIQLLVASGGLSPVAGEAAIEQLTSELLAATAAASAPTAPGGDRTTEPLPPLVGESISSVRTALPEQVKEEGGTTANQPAGPGHGRSPRSDVRPTSPGESSATDGRRARADLGGVANWGAPRRLGGPPYRGAGLALRLLLVASFVMPVWLGSVVCATHIGPVAFGEGALGAFFGLGFIYASALLAAAVSWTGARHGAFWPSRGLRWWLISTFLGLGFVGAFNHSTQALLDEARSRGRAAAERRERLLEYASPAARRSRLLEYTEPAPAAEIDAAVSEATGPRVAGTSTTADDGCDPSYPDVCIPRGPPDLDCQDIPQRRFRVLAPDPHQFDRNGDGLGCDK